MSSRISRCQVTFEEPVITDNSLCRVQVSVEEISKILSSLDVLKAVGPDKLPTIVLKECAESLAPSVTAVVNFGLRTGLQLTEGKKKNVPPIHLCPGLHANAKIAIFAKNRKNRKLCKEEDKSPTRTRDFGENCDFCDFSQKSLKSPPFSGTCVLYHFSVVPCLRF